MNDSSKFFSLKEKLTGTNLYLVGMMGSGKSKTGPLIAKALGYSFIDLDNVLEEVTKKSILEIFQDFGESEFRDLEAQVLKEVGQNHSLVIATGGGIVTIPRNWGVLHQGIVIWIDPARDCLLKRIQSDKTVRPLLQTSNPIEEFDKLLLQRKPIYLQSDLHIKVQDESPQKVADLILEELNNVIST